MRFRTDGYGTVSSALIALPARSEPDLRPVFRFAVMAAAGDAVAGCQPRLTARRRGVVPPEDDRYIEGWSIPLAAIAMKARVHVSLKSGVLDPQGKAIGNALASLGFTGIGEVRQGKLIELDLAETDPSRARAQVERMCQDLLANPVIEDYAIELC